MYNFSTQQKKYALGNITIGGQPGENPTVLMGTVFYGKRYRDMTAQIREEVEEYVQKQKEISEETGNPGILDVFVDSEEHIPERLGMMLDLIDPKEPFSVDIPEAEVRIAALEWLSQQGELHRVIYNSINLGITEEEKRCLGEHTPGASIVLGYNPRDSSTDGRLAILDNGAGLVEGGLIKTAKDAGIEKILLDTAATSFGNFSAEALRAVPAMKSKWGYPVGCSIHNTVESWKWLRQKRKDDPTLYKVCDIGSNGPLIVLGANWLVYGPVSSAPIAFPFAAMMDIIISEGAEEYFAISHSEKHPRERLM